MNMIKFSPLRGYINRKGANDFPTFWNEVDRIFDTFSDAGVPETFKDAAFVPALDIKEDNKQILVHAELPGLTENDIDVSIKDGVLTLKGEKKLEQKKEDQNFIRIERSYGSFHRSLAISSEIDESKIEAVFKNGVLSLTLPKIKQDKKEQKIQIKTA